MSAPTIPPPNGQHKGDFIVITPHRCDRTFLEEIWLPIGGNIRLVRSSDTAKPETAPTPEKPKRRRGPQKSGLQLMLQSAREHGITPPSVGGFLQLPHEFIAILVLEPKPVTLVVLEVLRLTIGTVVKIQDGQPIRREWAEISQRHFARTGIMSNKDAWNGIAGTLEQGYILRRQKGKNRFEYSVRWRSAN
jgi:hypothetical protein